MAAPYHFFFDHGDGPLAVPPTAKRRREEPAGLQLPVKPGSVPVFLMMPLDWMVDGDVLRNPEKLQAELPQLKAHGVSGVMADIWWGFCEPEPRQYHFGALRSLCQVLQAAGLKLQATLSFHQCGGNVGDSVNIGLPAFVLEAARPEGLFYRSRTGTVTEECLSLSADARSIFACGPSSGQKRSALECYRDYIEALTVHCSEYLGGTIVEMQVGMGPCGELRYPSYMGAQGWEYPGVGLVMAYDEGMKQAMRSSLGMAEPPEGFSDDPNALPDDAPNFRAVAGEPWLFRSEAVRRFLEWYSVTLLAHGEAILRAAEVGLQQAAAKLSAEQQQALKGVELSVKVAGLHWHGMHPSRATEACAGYDCCTAPRADAYAAIAEMLSRVARDIGRAVVFNFTCFEMTNLDNSGNPVTRSAPEDLIAQVRRACVAYDVPLSGENALEIVPSPGHDGVKQLAKQVRHFSPGSDRLHALTLLRFNEAYLAKPSLEALGRFIAAL